MTIVMQHDTDLIIAYSAHQKVRGFSQRTIDRRIWSLGHLIRLAPFADHTPVTIETFLSRWPSAQTRYSMRSDAHQFYRWAIRRGILVYDPTEGVDAPKLPKRAATPMSDEDLMRSIAFGNLDQRRAVMLGAYAGLRCSEIAHLDCSDVHRSRRVLVVRGGKGGKDEVIPLADALAMVLPLRGPAVRYVDGPGVGEAVRRLFRSLGIDARPHDLRHTFGTAAARRANGNMELVRQLMRHESIMTTQRYVQWSPDGGDVIEGLYLRAA